jgi:hypothetical protein
MQLCTTRVAQKSNNIISAEQAQKVVSSSCIFKLRARNDQILSHPIIPQYIKEKFYSTNNLNFDM